MNIIIIEDEKMAAKRLETMLLQVVPESTIIAKLESVKKSIEWLQSHDQPDLIFMDIQLGDGLSFEIFEHVNISAPIIFTTAYDEYALKAFKVNSIDYLLKPIDNEGLNNSIKKLKGLQKNSLHSTEDIMHAMEMLSGKYKNRFLVKTGEHMKSISVDNIHYFFSREKATFCSIAEGKNYILDYTLDQLDQKLDPELFFRISRQFIISMDSIKDIISYSNSRLKLIFINESTIEAIVSRDRVADFKLWLDR